VPSPSAKYSGLSAQQLAKAQLVAPLHFSKQPAPESQRVSLQRFEPLQFTVQLPPAWHVAEQRLVFEQSN